MSMNQLFIDVSPIISATNNGRRTKLPPFEPSRCDESNGGGFVLLTPLDAEIIGKTSKNRPFYRRFADYLGNESQVKSQSIGYLPDRSLFFRSAIRFVR